MYHESVRFAPSLIATVLLVSLVPARYALCDEPELYDTIAKAISEKDRALSELYVHWMKVHDVFPAANNPIADADVHAAIKGEKRYFERTLTQHGGRPLPADALHTGASYDGKESRVLLFTSHLRLWRGNKLAEYRAPDEFLGIQGYPRSNYFIWIQQDERKVDASLTTILGKDNYDIAPVSPEEPVALVCVKSAHDHIYLDGRLGFALVRREIFSLTTGQLLRRFTCDEWEQPIENVWLARHITDELFDSDKLTLRSHLRVATIDVKNVSDDMFSLRIPAGINVADMRHSTPNPDGSQAFLNYRFPTDPAKLDAVIAAAQSNQERHEIQAAKGRNLRIILLAINLFAFFAIGAFYLYRRHRSQ